MLDTLSQISWVLLGFLAGYLLRRGGVAKAEDAGFIFKIVFYVCIPALVFGLLATIHITRHLLIFTLLSTLLYPVGYLVGRLAMPCFDLSPLRKPVFLIATMGLNSVFALPFLQSLYGAEGLSRYIAYDIANTILLYSWAYAIAVKANPHHGDVEGIIVKKLSRSLPLWAVALGLLVNVTNIDLPSFMTNTATVFGAPTGFLVTLAIGISLEPKLEGWRITLAVMALRTGSAVAVGLVIIALFDLQGVDRVAVILFTVAPIAFSSATFASLEKLDVAFAARTLSVSLLTGIVTSTVCALLFV